MPEGLSPSRRVKLEFVPDDIIHAASLMYGQGLNFSFLVTTLGGKVIQTRNKEPLFTYLTVDRFDWSFGDFTAVTPRQGTLVRWVIATIWEQLEPRIKECQFWMDPAQYPYERSNPAPLMHYHPQIRTVGGVFEFKTQTPSHDYLLHASQFK